MGSIVVTFAGASTNFVPATIAVKIVSECLKFVSKTTIESGWHETESRSGEFETEDRVSLLGRTNPAFGPKYYPQIPQITQIHAKSLVVSKNLRNLCNLWIDTRDRHPLAVRRPPGNKTI